MDYAYETNLIAQGHSNICGIDEAGRGALAGPLVAGAVILDPSKIDVFSDVRDSKLLSEARRAVLLPLILENVRAWAIGVVTNEELDKHGLSFANKIAMKRAWKHLPIKPGYILSDYMARVYFETPFELIIDGDRKILSVAAASIIAKVFRDRMMMAFSNKYTQYGFDIHKGYGTALHLERLTTLGACSIHRKSFGPVRAKFF